MAITKIENLIDPQVLSEYLDVKLMDAIKFAPLCTMRNDLVGRPGATLTLPTYGFIGLAEDVLEGADLPEGQLNSSTVDVKVKKAGKRVTLTDESILYAYGDPAEEVSKQLLMAIAGKVDNDCVAEFRKATLAVTADAFDKYVISDMIAKFGEDIEEDMTVVINPAHLAALRKDPDFVEIMAGQKIISGEIGQLFGCRVVISNKCAATECFLVKTGAVKILMKRNVLVEADRDISNQTNIYTVSEHYVVYLEDATKIVKATIGA